MNKSIDLSQQNQIAELINYKWHLTEENLVNWWLYQAESQSSLCTTEGERIFVLDTGERNDGPGPDILNARLMLDDREMSGSVEMHWNSKDWYDHKHHLDSIYDGVILHVVTKHSAGPDIPTLQVGLHHLGKNVCRAAIPVSTNDLLHEAHIRFMEAETHMNQLALSGFPANHLVLGMAEVLLAGKHRQQSLQELALNLGMTCWPDAKPWQGSFQSYPHLRSTQKILDNLFMHKDCLRLDLWQDISISTWQAWDIKGQAIMAFGITRNQYREWLVNKLAPSVGGEKGFNFWLEMKPFRHYGLEKRMKHRLGIEKIETLASQQGVIAWYNKYCKTLKCSTCPLIQPHQALTGIN